MKKIMVILLALSMVLSFSTNAFASTNDDQFSQGVALIDEANSAIDEKIEIAVKQADELQAAYINEISKIEQSEIDNVKSEITKRKEAIASNKYSFSEVLRMKKEIADFEVKILSLSANLEKTIASISKDIEDFMNSVGPEVTPTNEALYTAIQELTEKLNKHGKKYVSSTDTYVKKLDKVVTDCYNVTLAMSNEAITKAAEKGVHAECSWKLVRFGHLWVWIDPIKIIGRN